MSNHQSKKRAELIGRALQIARARGGRTGRAEGGEVRDPLDVAPKGWRDMLLTRESDVAPAPPGDAPRSSGSPRQSGLWETMGPLAEFAMQNYVMPESVEVQGRSPGEYVQEELGRDLTPGNVAMGVLAASPMERIPAALRLAGELVRKNPGKVMGGVGGAGALVPSATSGDEGESPEAEIKRLAAEKEKLVATRDAATKQFLTTSGAKQAELEGKGKGKGKGVGPLSNALGETAKGVEAQAARYNTEIDKIDKRLEYLQHTMTPEYQDEQTLIQENIAARKPWYEKTGIPGFEQGATWGPAVGAAILMRGKMNKITQEGIDLVSAAQAARKANDVGGEAAALTALDAWKRSAPKEAVMALTKTVLLPGAVRTTGMAGDATFGANVKDKDGNILPGGAAQQAQHHLGRMFGTEGATGALEEWGPPVLQGFEAASLGALASKRPPRAPIEAETSFLRGIKNPEASGMDRMLGRDGHRSMSPDQIALELARRRSGVQGAKDSLDRVPIGSGPRPTPLWSQSMRGEPTTRALPPPGGSSPSSMTEPPRLAPPTTSSQTVREELGAPRAAAPSQPKPLPTSSLNSPLDAADEAGARIVRQYKKQGVTEWLTKDGRTVFRRSKGTPQGGDFASAALVKRVRKSKAEAGAQQPKADDGPQMDENGNWVKPPKPPEDRFSAGGHVQRLLGMARKYASGGAVTGALMGNTGGRADELKTQVAAGSHIIPADVVSHHGQGNTMAGFEVMKRIFGDEPPELAAGGAVPVYLSDGEYAVSPRGVERYGGHDKIDQFILASRKQAIETLKALPPPAR